MLNNNNAPKWQVIAHKVRALFHITMRYFFTAKPDGGYNHISREGIILDNFISESLAHIMCDCDNALEMIRIRRENGDEIVVQKRPLNISMIL